MHDMSLGADGLGRLHELLSDAYGVLVPDPDCGAVVLLLDMLGASRRNIVRLLRRFSSRSEGELTNETFGLLGGQIEVERPVLIRARDRLVAHGYYQLLESSVPSFGATKASVVRVDTSAFQELSSVWDTLRQECPGGPTSFEEYAALLAVLRLARLSAEEIRGLLSALTRQPLFLVERDVVVLEGMTSSEASKRRILSALRANGIAPSSGEERLECEAAQSDWTELPPSENVGARALSLDGPDGLHRLHRMLRSAYPGEIPEQERLAVAVLLDRLGVHPSNIEELLSRFARGSLEDIVKALDRVRSEANKYVDAHVLRHVAALLANHGYERIAASAHRSWIFHRERLLRDPADIPAGLRSHWLSLMREYPDGPQLPVEYLQVLSALQSLGLSVQQILVLVTAIMPRSEGLIQKDLEMLGVFREARRLGMSDERVVAMLGYMPEGGVASLKRLEKLYAVDDEAVERIRGRLEA